MRRFCVAALSLLFAAGLLPTGVSAQQLSELAPGARVRIRAPGIVAGRYTGTVLSRTPDTLVVASSGAASVRVPVAGLTSVEVSRGNSRSRGAMKGAMWGAGIGLGFGLLTAGVVDDGAYGSAGEYVAYNVAGGRDLGRHHRRDCRLGAVGSLRSADANVAHPACGARAHRRGASA